MTAQLTIDVAGPECDPDRAQWLTAPPLARELVALAGTLFDDARRRSIPIRVLEPSAGRGNLVRAILERCPCADVLAVEIDPRWRADLDALGELGGVTVRIADYLAIESPAHRYDLAVTNPPFDGGEEVEHLAKLLDEAFRILTVLPARSMHGRRRYDRVWRRFDERRDERDWYVRQKVLCTTRPPFGERGGSDEIVLLDLSRTPGPCVVRWL